MWPDDQIGYLFNWFSDLSDWRSNAFSVGPIPHQEIESWARLIGISISPFELTVLKRLDREYCLYQDEKANPKPVSIVQTLKAQQEEHKKAKLKGRPSGR
jgi:hypothetical protein